MTLNDTILPVIMMVLGVAIVVVTVAGGGGPLANGILIGALFGAAGAARLALGRRRKGR